MKLNNIIVGLNIDYGDVLGFLQDRMDETAIPELTKDEQEEISIFVSEFDFNSYLIECLEDKLLDELEKLRNPELMEHHPLPSQALPEPPKTFEEQYIKLSDMTQEIWDSMSATEKDNYRDNSGLCQQLIGKEGMRVKVITMYNEVRSFWVGKSTGWRPCHIEISRSNARSGPAADKEYKRVTILKRSR